MADETIKKLLIKLGISTSDWKVAINQIKTELNAVNAKAKADAIAQKQLQKDQLSVIKETITDEKRLAAEARTIGEMNRANLILEQKKQATIRTTIQQKILETTEEKKQQVIQIASVRLAQEQIRLEQQKYRLAEQQRISHEKLLRSHAESSGIGGVFAKLSKTLIGGGTFGLIASGVAGGEVIGNVFEGAAEKVHDLFKELTLATGGATQLRNTFETLSTLRGSKPTELLEGLSKATRGLVADIELYKVANNFMRSGMKITDEQMIKLVGSTVNLARANNRLGSAVPALERFFITGQARALGAAVGLSRQALALKGLSSSLDDTTRKTLEITKVQSEFNKALEKQGIPLTTLPELMQQVSIAEKNFIEDMAVGILKGSKFGDSIDGMSKRLIELEPKLKKIAEDIGGGIGKAVDFTTEHIDDLTHAFEAFLALAVVTKLAKWVASLKEVATTLGIIKEAEIVTGATGVVSGVASAAGAGAAAGAEGVAGGAAAIGAAAIAPLVLSVISLLGLAWVFNKLRQENAAESAGIKPKTEMIMTPFGPIIKRQEVGVAGVNLPKTMASGKYKSPVEAPTGPTPEEIAANIQAQRKIAQQQMQLRQLNNKIIVDELKQRIAEEERLEKEKYEDGIITLSQYVARQKELKTEEFEAAKKELRDDLAAQLQNLKTKNEITIDGTTYLAENAQVAAGFRTLAIQKEHDKEIVLQSKHNAELGNLDRQLRVDQRAAYKIYTDTIAEIANKGIQERIKLNEVEFKEGLLGADAYIQKRRDLIEEERVLANKGLDERALAAKGNEQELATIAKERVDVEIKAADQVAEFESKQDQIRLEALKNHYEQSKKYIEASLAAVKGTGGIQERETELQLTALLRQQAEARVSSLNTLRSNLETQYNLTDETRGLNTEWIQTTEQIAQAQQESNKMRLQLIEMRDTAAPLAGVFGSIARVAGLTQTRTGNAVAETASRLQSSFEDFSKFNRGVGAAGGFGQLSKNLGQSFLGIFGRGHGVSPTAVKRTATEIFDAGLIKSTSIVDRNSEAVARLTKELESLAAIISGARDKVIPIEPGIPSGIRAQNRPGFIGEAFAEGGPITKTGPIVAHEGEFVLSKSMLSGIATGFHAMVTAVQTVTDKFIKLGGVVGGVASKSTPLEVVPIDHPKAKKGGLSGTFTSMLDSIKGGKSKDGTDKKDDQSSSIQAFGDAVATFADGVSGFIKGITGAKSGGEGAVSGGMAGLKLGSETGLPFAGAIGAGIGATIGGITGAKNKQLQQDIHKIQTQFQSIVADLQAGTISMGQAITDLRNERKAAIAMLSSNPKGGKGGGKGGKKGYSPTQAQAVIEQIDAQISQLVAQQQKTLESLHASLMEISQPIQFQEYIQSLDTIVQKYQEFASAAQGNAQEVAVANEFLNQSLQNYVQTLSHDLNAAQQTAINDALTLINLEYQRQQLINQEAQQEYDILTQGVLVRQRTTAMTKGQEIGQLRYQRDMQLEQMNEQIALAQHKVDAETKIFGLAKDRIGLETQLLAAQTEQADYQIAQVQALASVLAALQSGLSGGSLMAKIEALMSSGAVPTESGLLFALLQELGLGGNVPPAATQGPYGVKNWLSTIPSTDASAAQYVASQDSNFPYMIAGGQFSAAAADAQQYVQQGEVEGFNMTGLVAWLQSQTNMPSHEAGGPISTTGPYIGHAGEYVLSNPMIKVLNNFMKVGGSGGVNNSRVGNTDSLSLTTHKAILDMTSQRSNMEMQVIGARHAQLGMEMDHLQMLQDTLDKITQSSSGVGQTSFEGMLAKVYEVRGRYGSANFRRETL